MTLKKQILAAAYKLRYDNPKLTLGQAIRQCANGLLDDEKYNFLSKLDGLVAVYEFGKVLGENDEG